MIPGPEKDEEKTEEGGTQGGKEETEKKPPEKPLVVGGYFARLDWFDSLETIVNKFLI